MHKDWDSICDFPCINSHTILRYPTKKLAEDTRKLAEASIKQVEITRRMFDLARGKKQTPFEILKTEKSGDSVVVFLFKVKIEEARVLYFTPNVFNIDFELPKDFKKGQDFKISLPIQHLSNQTQFSIRFRHGEFFEEGSSVFEYSL